ncbi:hypothetical protein BDV27DRAFT_86970 [Aspergillus caelatus]|uniref:Uncharacterized protein n=1 Tax=Aspergillus caelatus TaxID=61420 RepID=A0A5N6ZJ64_9EURO|nr:uncharacterized protein BDV27DRAFT_86970 [Aspergillus caelatus]KAE8357418.1 hypothetical protein BDV27DRAFT_86970 [Aspergillus caelatus]
MEKVEVRWRSSRSVALLVQVTRPSAHPITLQLLDHWLARPRFLALVLIFGVLAQIGLKCFVYLQDWCGDWNVLYITTSVLTPYISIYLVVSLAHLGQI